ncbi:hypothetical protein PAHAL_5G155100 [Panicum hallii]|uniref:Uncharacterized protein n=1 Tax=Panicum hallii TaxID=206008 RepID=A0A2T8IK30_9POAL|nr:hypothetical protein PAHAL_5G155100 [Panicum hallii]
MEAILPLCNGMINSQTFKKQEESKGNKTKHRALSSSKTERPSSTLYITNLALAGAISLSPPLGLGRQNC